MRCIIFSILLLSTTSSAYVSILRNGPVHCFRRGGRQTSSLNESTNDSEGDTSNDASNDALQRSLSQRISEVQQSESSFVAGLQKRVKSVAKAEEFDSSITNNNNSGPTIVELPVVCFDALLPNQRLAGSTTDPTFCNLLRSIGLGGTFVMTSLNTRQRKIRRFGVVARIELVDVDGDDNSNKEEGGDSLFSTPTAVAFSIVGKRRCEILGQAEAMKERIGRWRRGYDPDGEESRLGWGDERFVDKQSTQILDGDSINQGKLTDERQWTSNKILIIDEAAEDADATSDAIAKATYLIPLVERWIALASDQTTYDNVDVVAATRRKSGEPGLSVNASALLRNVQQDLGPMPSPDNPTAFATWGAALINPLPALGVSTELRGAVLEAEGAERKLGVLERGLIKSLNNLDGTRPLNM